MPNTPARPELPEPDLFDWQSNNWGYANSDVHWFLGEREAWARADERRQALESAKIAVSETVCSCCYTEDERAVADSCVEAVQRLIDKEQTI